MCFAKIILNGQKGGRVMERIEKSIEVDCPVSTVYNQWTQFEEFPHFMKNVNQVTQLDDKRLHWEAEIGGKTKEWIAKIVEQVPDHHIAWQSERGEFTSGRVSFAPADGNRTRVNLELSYDPKGFVESAGDALGMVSAQIKGDLERFKEFIETRCRETRAWRGTIHDQGR
jgi:uncharacterized membrane protein